MPSNFAPFNAQAFKNLPVSELLRPDYAPAGQGLDIPKRSDPVGTGFLVVDKPLGMSSADVVARLRRICGTRRIGHAGTLDPAASGVLIAAVGRATKLIQFLQGLRKTYTARVCFGITTDTEDAQGQILQRTPVAHPFDLEPHLAQFRGKIQQIPSSYSAIKVAGRRAHEAARVGESLELAGREVEIYDLFVIQDLKIQQYLGQSVAVVDLVVSCSAGTYVRALARDLGQVTGLGAHLLALRRIAVGDFRLGLPSGDAELDQLRAWDLEQLAACRGAVPIKLSADPAGGRAVTLAADPADYRASKPSLNQIGAPAAAQTNNRAGQPLIEPAIDATTNPTSNPTSNELPLLEIDTIAGHMFMPVVISLSQAQALSYGQRPKLTAAQQQLVDEYESASEARACIRIQPGQKDPHNLHGRKLYALMTDLDQLRQVGAEQTVAFAYPDKGHWRSAQTWRCH